MSSLLNGLLLVLLTVSLVSFSLFSMFSRFFLFLSQVSEAVVASITSPAAKLILYFLIVTLLSVNILGNIPLTMVPSMFYSYTMTLSVVFWTALILCVVWTDLNGFFAHLLPYGCPIGLMLFLPLVELFSIIIRPLTLIIRISTNLAAGHIMVYMFSYFALLSPALGVPLSLAVSVLIVLELIISLLQAYIFCSLLALYVEETL